MHKACDLSSRNTVFKPQAAQAYSNQDKYLLWRGHRIRWWLSVTLHKSGFQLSVESNFVIASVFHCYAL